MSLAKELIDRQQNVERSLGTYYAHCAEVAKYVAPSLDTFFTTKVTPGEKRTQSIYDSTAIFALERFASIMQSLVAPNNSYWHTLEPDTEDLLDDHEAMVWFEKVRNHLFRLRYGYKSNFSSQINQVMLSMGAFGPGVLVTESRPGQWLRYRNTHIKEHFFTENADGFIDTNYRKYTLTARQAAETFGASNLSDKIKSALERNDTQTKFTFLHCVFPNEERVSGVLGPKGMAYASFHVDVEGQTILGGQKGYRKFPFHVARYTTTPEEIYGRSPAMTVLADIKMRNQAAKTDIKQRHVALDPPNLVSSDINLRSFSLKPGALNPGTLDMNGNPLVRPYQSGARFDTTNDMMDRNERSIKDAFLINLFQILIETPEMTATEFLGRQREKGDLLSPIAGRIENEFLSRIIEREIDELAFSGAFDRDGVLPMPDSVRAAGGAYKVTYTSPMSQFRLSGEAAGAEKTLQSLIPVAQVDPTAWEYINIPEYIKIIAKASGAPARMMVPAEVVAKNKEARAEAEQMNQIAQTAPAIAGSIKDLAQAQAVG